MKEKLDKNKNSNAESKKGDDFYQMIHYAVKIWEFHCF
jgi:hypothetical protein